MRILCTGGAGFIGSHLVDRLVAAGHEVVGIDDFSGGTAENLNPGADTHTLDLRDAGAVDRVIRSIKPEIVYHLAANAAENKAQFSPIDITSRNYSAFVNTLVPAIRYGMRRFVFTSSIAVYGAGQTPFKETDRPEPEDLYGVSKHAAEQSLHILSNVHGFDYVITRPHNIYGPRQNMRDPYRNVVTIWMNAILRNEPYVIYGDGEQVRQFSYIGDVAEQLMRCGFEQVSGMTFNLGSSIPYTLNQLSDAIRTVTGTNIEPRYLPERPQEVKVAVADHSLADHSLGECKTDLLSGLTVTWEWCRAQGPQSPIYTEIELPSERMPANWRKTAY